MDRRIILALLVCLATACTATSGSSNGDAAADAPTAAPDVGVADAVTVDVDGAAPAGGWQELPNTKLEALCPSPSPGGSGGCTTIISAWGGAAARTKAGSEQLILWGGGHSDYYGNEVYALNLNVNPPTLTRLTDPSVVDLGGGDSFVSDGLPVSRHTYNGLAYLAGPDRMFSFEGGRMPNGSGGGFTWTLDLGLTPPAWHKMYPTAGVDLSVGVGSVTGAVCAFDINTDSVICNWGNLFEFVRYTFKDNTWTALTSYGDSVVPYASTSVVDPKRKKLFFFGDDLGGVAGTPTVQSVDISAGSTFAVDNITAQTNHSCDPLAVAHWPGLAYDSAIDKIVGWAGSGGTVFVFDPDAGTCTTLNFPGGPTPTVSTGTFGRFAYFPSLDAFAVVSQGSLNAYLLRLK